VWAIFFLLHSKQKSKRKGGEKEEKKNNPAFVPCAVPTLHGVVQRKRRKGRGAVALQGKHINPKGGGKKKKSKIKKKKRPPRESPESKTRE